MSTHVPAARTPTVRSSAPSTWATSWSSRSASPTGGASAPTRSACTSTSSPSDVLRFRLDDRECRFLIQRGPAEDVMAVGWQIDDHETFDRILSRVTERGVPIAEGTPEEAALRGVERLWRFAGPKGIAQEIFTAPLTHRASRCA